MMSFLEKFIAECNKKRQKDTENFSLVNEFKNLNETQKREIFESIDKYKLRQVTAEDKLLPEELGRVVTRSLPTSITL